MLSRDPHRKMASHPRWEAQRHAGLLGPIPNLPQPLFLQRVFVYEQSR